MQIIRAEGGGVMGVFDKLREKWHKRKIYKRLCNICEIESCMMSPYEEALPPAFMYLEAGEYELYFKDLELIHKKQLQEQREKVLGYDEDC